jgi:hypothetical protein
VQFDGPPERIVSVERKEIEVFAEVFTTLLARQNAGHRIKKLGQSTRLFI